MPFVGLGIAVLLPSDPVVRSPSELGISVRPQFEPGVSVGMPPELGAPVIPPPEPGACQA